jgi:predicted nucleic acid-binding Zn ribbon protein
MTGPEEERIDGVMERALNKLGVGRQVREVRVQEALERVVGPAVAPLCSAVSLDRGTLVITTANGALAHQLQLDSPRLIEGLNREMGADVVKRVRFAGGPRRR